jgi:hypothetical protein
MKVLEFVIQLALASVALVSVVFLRNVEGGIIIAILAQLLIGITQLIGATVHTLKHDFKYPLNTKVNFYWIGTVLYMIAYVFSVAQTGDFFHPVFVIGAWILATYYGYLTFQLINSRNERSKFLPNLDFYA